MDAKQVSAVLGDLDERWDTGERARMLAGLSPVYESNGVIAGGVPCSLQRCCPSAPSCWRDAPDRLQPVRPADQGPGVNGSIFWPWIGEQYQPGGVCLVALNINHAESEWWSLAVEYAITSHVVDGLAAGRKRIWPPSEFHYRALATASAALASLAGEAPVAAPAPEDLAPVMEHVARVQAIKCAPTGGKSEPTREMAGECPPRFARHELAHLRPGVLIALGGDARWAVELLGDVHWHEHDGGFRRGTVVVDAITCDVIGVPHPTSRGHAWANGQQQLVESLVRSPLRPRT